MGAQVDEPRLSLFTSLQLKFTVLLPPLELTRDDQMVKMQKIILEGREPQLIVVL